MKPALRGRWRAVAVGLVAVLAVGACGGGDEPAAPPKPVPAEMVPANLAVTGSEDDLTFTEYEPARAQFAQAGVRSVVADGRLWEIRQGSTLIGTLQVSTLKPKVEIDERKKRESLAGLVLPGTFTAIRVSGIEVHTTSDGQLTTYMWFGDRLFEVLQLKSPTLKPEQVLRSLIRHQLPTKQLVQPPTEEEERRT